MKTVLITGCTSGIGKVTAKELAAEGHELILANRNRGKSEQLSAELKADTGNENIHLYDLDLASRASVDACCEAVLAAHPRIDVLINNAGLTSFDEVITEDGNELQFAVNALNQLQLTLALLPALKAAAPSQVLFVTSMMHKFGKLNPDTFNGWEKYNGNGSYSQSKLVMTMLARELADKLQGSNIAVNSLHPGAVNTGILDNYSKFAQFFLRRLFISPEKGAKTTLFLARRDADSDTGKYYDKQKPAKNHPLVDDDKRRAELWLQCCEMLGRDPAIA